MGRCPITPVLAAAVRSRCRTDARRLPQSRPELIPFPGRTKAVLYRPDSGPAPHVGIIVMHRTSNYLTHRACTELSRRGFLMLCMNSRFENNEPAVEFEKLPLDVKMGVEFLRKQPGITKVVLFGHSGGGPIMALYQAVAEKGTAYCKGANKLIECGDDLAGLAARRRHRVHRRASRQRDQPAARDQSVGRQREQPSGRAADRRARSVQSQERLQSQRRFELFGGIPGALFPGAGRSHEPADRQRARQARPHEAQRLPLSRRRHHRHSARRQSGSGPGASAALFIAHAEHRGRSTPRRGRRGCCATTAASTEVIKSVYVADPKLSRDNLRFGTGTKIYTLRSFLSANAIRAKHSIDDIDYCSTNNSTVCAVQSITVPVLFAAMGAHYFIRDNERLFDLSASKDKDFITIEGAVHGLTPCTRCEKTPGQYSNSVRNLYDYIAKWLNDRYR